MGMVANNQSEHLADLRDQVHHTFLGDPYCKNAICEHGHDTGLPQSESLLDGKGMFIAEPSSEAGEASVCKLGSVPQCCVLKSPVTHDTAKILSSVLNRDQHVCLIDWYLEHFAPQIFLDHGCTDAAAVGAGHGNQGNRFGRVDFEIVFCQNLKQSAYCVEEHCEFLIVIENSPNMPIICVKGQMCLHPARRCALLQLQEHQCNQTVPQKWRTLASLAQALTGFNCPSRAPLPYIIGGLYVPCLKEIY